MHYWRPRGEGGGSVGFWPGGGGGGAVGFWPGGGGGGGVVSYPDPDSRSCGWITSPLRGKRVW